MSVRACLRASVSGYCMYDSVREYGVCVCVDMSVSIGVCVRTCEHACLWIYLCLGPHSLSVSYMTHAKNDTEVVSAEIVVCACAKLHVFGFFSSF